MSQYFETVCDELKGTGGYWIDHRVLNTEQHGIPQHRNRVYIVLIREDSKAHDLQWPEPLGEQSLSALLCSDSPDEDTRSRNWKVLSCTARSNIQRLTKARSDLGLTLEGEGLLVDCNPGPEFAKMWANRIPCLLPALGGLGLLIKAGA